jgi:flagellar basal body-associated protein FliL
MQNDQQKHSALAKRIIIVAVVLVALFAVGMGVAILLKSVSNLAKDNTATTDTTQNDSTNSGAPSAASVINGYINPETIRTFTKSYQLQQDTTAPARITYTADGQKYEVSLSTSNYAMFYAKDGIAHSDAAVVQQKTTEYMSDKGFQKAAAKAGSAVTTYTDRGSVCQLTSMPGSSPAYYLMACADKVDVDKEYATIESLLDLYRKDNRLSTFTRAITSTVTSGNKAMTTISLTTTPTVHPLLLFAAVDDKWAYIGDVGGSNGAVSNGKYSLTPQIQTAIHDQKYGNFLVDNLQ